MDSTLPNPLRRTVTTVTDVLFPVAKSAHDPQKHQILKAGNEYVSNLPLQIALYFNAFFSPFWLISTIVIMEIKYPYLSSLYNIMLIAIYIVYTIIEVIRLYIGFLGNLTERVPELAGSWLLTLLIQFPLILLLVFNDEALLLPLERAVHIIEALFVLFEVICGYFAVRTMVNYQVTKFHLRQFTDLEQMPTEEYWHDKYESYT
ncbi:hypothetical protein FSP39_022773 [Pinctada imbricata]|uniref:Transmembrane protein 17 n=1 Tax=Pinctada imbricata TaxID=66713 RepID=A0AA88XPE0_PINIB|nr:hypothetical protein FSP39_022773 [Pinctada imbricata]